MTREIFELIQRSQKGEKEAFGRLYSLFLKKVYRFIYFMIYDEAMAEDLTQDTFFKVWKSLPSFSPARGSFNSYLLTIARNNVIDYQRKKKEIYLNPIMEDEIPSSEVIEDNVIKTEEQQEARSILAKLEGADRRLIILRFFEELSMAEIAKMENLKEGAVRVKIYRILRKMKNLAD